MSRTVTSRPVVPGLAARVKRLRGEMPIAQLAKLSGVSISTIEYVENGTRSLSLYAATQLAKALNVSLDQLTTGRRKPAA